MKGKTPSLEEKYDRLLSWIILDVGYLDDTFIENFPVECFTDLVNKYIEIDGGEPDGFDAYVDALVSELRTSFPNDPIVKKWG